MSEPNDNDLRVRWIPQVPGKPFHAPVKDIEEAKLILRTLADYDLFQLFQNIKPNYSNAGGLEVYGLVNCTDYGWSEWENDDGDDIDSVMRTE